MYLQNWTILSRTAGLSLSHLSVFSRVFDKKPSGTPLALRFAHGNRSDHRPTPKTARYCYYLSIKEGRRCGDRLQPGRRIRIADWAHCRGKPAAAHNGCCRTGRDADNSLGSEL